MDPYHLAILYLVSLFFLMIFLLGNFFRDIPTERIRQHRIGIMLKNYPLVWAFLVVNVVFDASERILINLVLLIFILVLTYNDNRSFKRLWEEELRRCKANPADETAFPKKPVLSAATFGMLLTTSALASLFLTVLLVRQNAPILRGTEEHLVGGVLLMLMLLGHLIFFSTCFLLFRHRETEDTSLPRENDWYEKDALYDRILEFKGRRDYRAGFVGIIVFGLWLLLIFTTPFFRDVLERISYPNNITDQDFDHPESAELLAVDGNSTLNISATSRLFYQPEKSCLTVSLPLGFALEEAGRLLWSEGVYALARSRIETRLKQLEHKPLLGSAILEPDQIQFVFLYNPSEQGPTFEFLKNDVLHDEGDEAAFVAERSKLLERLEIERSSPDHLASKFALAARHQACDYGKKEIQFFDGLERASWGEVREYYRERFSQIRSPLLGEICTNPGAVNTLESALESLKPLEMRAIQKPLPPNPVRPGEYHAAWDMPRPAIVASWPVPDPAQFPEEHAALTFAMRALEHRIRSNPDSPGLPSGCRCGHYLAPEGLVVYCSTVWEERAKSEENLRHFDRIVARLGTEESDWSAIKNDRARYANSIAPFWIGPLPERNAAFASEWGMQQFRYFPFLKTPEQHCALAKEYLWLSSRAVRNAAAKYLTEEARTLVVLEPKEFLK